MLKNYEAHQKKVTPKPEKPESSGVACTEKKCKGEMMVQIPVGKHPQLRELRRAICSECKWKGWV